MVTNSSLAIMTDADQKLPNNLPEKIMEVNYSEFKK